MSAEDHKRYEEDIGAYLLGALDPGDLQAFETHLEGCVVCRAEVDRLRVAADALPRSVEPFAPPASLKRSLMRTVREEAGENRRARAPLAERLGLSRLVSGMRPELAWVSAAFILIAGIAVGFAVTELARSGGSDQRVLSAAVDRGQIPRGSASLVVPKRGAGETLRVSGFPPPRPGDIYEVWLKRGNQLQHSSLFSVGADGSGSAGIPDSLDGVDAVLVTQEKGPTGAMAPTHAPLLSIRT